jgi:hypothetical protein
MIHFLGIWSYSFHLFTITGIPIILLFYYLIILLSYYLIILLSYYPIILLSYYPIPILNCCHSDFRPYEVLTLNELFQLWIIRGGKIEEKIPSSYTIPPSILRIPSIGMSYIL